MRKSVMANPILPKSYEISIVWVLCLLLLLITTATSYAQRMSIPITDNLPTAPSRHSGNQQEEEEFIKPSRPGVASPAEIQKAGVLQVEYGYDVNFRADEFRTQQTVPLALRFAASGRLLLELDPDIVKSETEENGNQETGVGDTRLGFQVVANKETGMHPALGFAYYVKLPSASREKGLGTGRVDHKVIALLSKKFGEADMDINVAYLNVGREDSNRRASGGQGAVSLAYEFENNLGVEGELSGQSLDDVQPRGIFALGALTYKVSRRLQFDGGVRFGLNPGAPRVGVFAGMVIGAADLFRK
jgi:Putative MetA-pathway of phenol degradation